MRMWQLCFDWRGRKHCVKIPVLIPNRPPLPIPGPDPDPFGFFADPDPMPWITAAGIGKALARDLQLAATIDRLAAALSPKARKAVQRTLVESVAPSLPEGWQVRIQG
jgi:hypothetical protein